MMTENMTHRTDSTYLARRTGCWRFLLPDAAITQVADCFLPACALLCAALVELATQQLTIITGTTASSHLRCIRAAQTNFRSNQYPFHL
jgi:hypothetical protein